MADAAYDVLYDELKALEESDPSLVTSDSPTQRVGAPLSDKFQKVRHLLPMGSLEKVTTNEALQKWEDDVRKRLGDRRADRLRRRAEDRRLRDQPHVRERPLRARPDARRRRPGRGRDAEPPHDQDDSPANEGKRRAAGPRGARRGVHAARRLPRRQRGARRRGESNLAEPTERRRRLAPAEGLDDHRGASARDLGVRHRLPRGPRPRDALGDPAVAARARLPHEPVCAAARVDRRGRRRSCASGSSAAPSSTTRSTGS